MSKLKYTPDRDIKVHRKGAIDLLCRPFQSHENGLPEWVKNSADAYVREDLVQEDRVIVLILRDGSARSPASISCLDFVGMTSDIIDIHFRYWADPHAAAQGRPAQGVQGGHGNGGKCYMTQMFEQYSCLLSVSQGKGNRYGVAGGEVTFGYVPDPEAGRDFDVANPEDELAQALDSLGCGISSLPSSAQSVLAARRGFSLVTGVGPKGYPSRLPVKSLMETLQEHPQMILSLQLTQVYVIHNGKTANASAPLSLPDIQPLEGAAEPRVVPIPDHVKDPATNERISTTNDGALPKGKLVLKTSNTSMRWSKKTRHSVTFISQSGYVGYTPVLELDIQSPYRDKIYGDCHLGALDPYKQNDRARLAEAPLTRGIERFVSGQIQKYAEEFERRDHRRYDSEEKDAISRINEALNHWKNRFLDDLIQNMWSGDGPGVGEPPRPPLPKGIPARIETAVAYPRIGRGVSIRPRLRFFDRDSTRIRPVPYRWISEDTNVAMVDEDLGIINSFSCGSTVVYAETLDGNVRSNRVPLEVVRVLEIRIEPGEVEVPAGSRQRLQAICKLPDGEDAPNVHLIWSEGNESVARVSSSGMVFGVSAGETEVIAGDDATMAESPAKVRVVPGEGRGEGDNKGRGYPKVLVSGEIDRDPDTGEYRHFSSDMPPVYQGAEDFNRNIWWINSSSPLAKLYLDKAKGYGFESREWRMYHLERYVDVIVQIALRYDPSYMGQMDLNDWILSWGDKVAQIQAAAAEDLSGFIAIGELPGDERSG